jgi:hypothetical protein
MNEVGFTQNLLVDSVIPQRQTEEFHQAFNHACVRVNGLKVELNVSIPA